MRLNELNTSPMKTTFVGNHDNNPNIKTYSFKTPTGTEMEAYIVTQHIDSRNRTVEVHFADKDENDIYGNLTGKGDAFAVFSTIAHLLKDAVDSDPGIVKIIIRGETQPASRVKLYRAFANRLPKMFPGFGAPSEQRENRMGLDSIILTVTRTNYRKIGLRPSTVNEVTIDNKNGIGQVPDNTNVDYLGLKVFMRPSMFLKLASPVATYQSLDGIKAHIASGGSIGAPFLDINIPADWNDNDLAKFAQVAQHEGRNRMKAILDVEGDDPVEVHLFFRGGYRNRHIKPEWKQKLQDGMISQTGSFINGPIFKI